MDEFNKEIELIEKKNPSEVNGPLSSYFTVTQRENGSYRLTWEKNVSTHIRHKVAALVKKHYVATTL
ncbi:hypothetical protein [Mucilaginibacter sp.]|uniref:hypothetical protein n=1 Tax=Mucilaginibacter sp. TaxID=1882438 RepID=UPI003D141D51